MTNDNDISPVELTIIVTGGTAAARIYQEGPAMTSQAEIEEQIEALRAAVVDRARDEGYPFATYFTSGWRWDPIYGTTYGSPEEDFCASVQPDDTVEVFAAGMAEASAVIPGAYALARRASTDLVLAELNHALVGV